MIVEHDQDFLQEQPKLITANFQKMAVREAGYQVCLDICKTADSLKKDNEIASRLRSKADP